MKTTNKTYRIQKNLLNEMPLHRGDFYADDCVCLIGNVEGLFDKEGGMSHYYFSNNLGNVKSLKLFDGLRHRISGFDPALKTIIIGEEKVINSYKNLFQDMTENSAFTTNLYDYNGNYPMTNNVMFIIVEEKEWGEIEDRTSRISGILTYINSMMKFDHIIANPPFSCANKIIDAVRTNLKYDEFFTISPISAVNSDNLRAYVNEKNIVSIPEGTFDDVSGFFYIFDIKKDVTNNLSKDYFDIFTFNSKFRSFYEENLKRDITWEYKLGRSNFVNGKTKEDIINKFKDNDINVKTSVLIPSVAATNGVHTSDEGSGEFAWNIDKNIGPEDLKYSTWSSGPKVKAVFLTFKSESSRNNFTTFYYHAGKKGLMNMLLKGLNKSYGATPCHISLPHINWETVSNNPLWIAGDYDSAVLDEMGLKWNATKDGVVRK